MTDDQRQEILKTLLALVLGIGAVVLVVVLLIWAMLAGIYTGLRNLWQTWQAAHRDYYTRLATMTPDRASALHAHPQPADRLYFYGAAMYVIRTIFRRIWVATRQSADEWRDGAEDRFLDLGQRVGTAQNWGLRTWERAMTGGLYAGVRLHYLATLILLLIFTTLQALVIVIGVGISTVLIWLFRLGGSVAGVVWRSHPRCIYLNCQAEMVLPIFVCPQCGRQHDRLQPGRYGVLYRRCFCGEKLPTLDWLGRAKLKKLCPTCKRAMPAAVGRGKAIYIALVGGSTAGKTSFLNAALQELRQQARYRLPEENQIVENTVPTLENDANAAAVLLQAKGRWRVRPRLLYFYDVAGAVYGSQDKVMQQGYLNYTQAIVFVVDPLSLDLVRELYRERLSQAAIPTSRDMPEDVLGRLINTLSAFGNLQRSMPVAVVVSKADYVDLKQTLSAAEATPSGRGKRGARQEADAMDAAVQRFLREYGAASFLLQMQNHFKQVRYFSSTAGQPSSQAGEALRWLVRRLGV